MVLAGLLSSGPALPDSRPNFLVVVVDDLGFSDLGFMGSEIRTPVLDQLAAEGLVMMDFHVSPACSPTRAMLLTGVDTHPAGFGTMWEEASPEQDGQWGYAGVLSQRVATVAERLQAVGYQTYLTGKWHLGKGPGEGPLDRGFDRAFGPRHGGSSHFADQLPMFFPGREKPGKAPFANDGESVTELPPDYFSSKDFTDRLIEQIESGREKDQPFLAFAMYTAPHWPLQVPDDWIDRYQGAYDAGWDALRAERMAAVKRLGLAPQDQPVPERLPWVPAWDSLAPEERARAARTMEVYAAMVENLDHHVGRLIAYLEASGQRDNTWIVFFSDNGAEGNPVNRIIDDHGWVERTFDNRLENIGRPGSYVFPGPGWGQVSSVPLALFKTFPSQGGIRTPAIVQGPGVTAGSRSSAFTHVMDITPTLLTLADAMPETVTFGGKTVAPLEGRSLAGLWRGETDAVRGPDDAVGWELFGRRALRQGDWKLSWLYEPYGAGRWQLFHLGRDPGETQDLALQEPERVAELLEAWEDYAARNRVILPARDAGYANEDDWRDAGALP